MNSEDSIDGVMASCLKKNPEDVDVDADIEEYQRRFRENVKISKTGKDDLYYSMNYRHKGLLIIFAHSTFRFAGLIDRNAEIDVIALHKTFRNLGFQVRSHKDYKLAAIKKVMETVATEDFEDYACIAIAVSSHGNFQLVSANDTNYDPEEILYAPIKNNRSLLGKPKLFFISACRGTQVDHGATALSQVQTDSGHLEEYTIPMEADRLTVYSTVFGYTSYSNSEDGSQFFKYLTEALKEYANQYDILTVLTLANRKLSINFTSTSSQPNYDNNKQCMSFLSTLTRLLKFEISQQEIIS